MEEEWEYKLELSVGKLKGFVMETNLQPHLDREISPSQRDPLSHLFKISHVKETKER